jgi:two-component system, sensor histidine kinase
MDALLEVERHLYRYSPDALVVVDDRGIIVIANATVQTLFGHAPDALIGKSIGALLPQRFVERHHGHVDGYLAAPQNREMGARITDLFARRADDTEFPAGIRLAPLEVGGKRFVAAAIRDMTERRRISDALVSAREDADQANRAKSRFLAIASHDLRQPLQTIRLLNAALQKLVESAQPHDLLRQQSQAIDGMTRLLDALLDVTRLESGAIEPHPSAVRLADVFDDLRAEFQSLAHSRGIELNVSTTSVVLSTDRALLHQLLQNLLANALKYTDVGRVSIDVGLDSTGIVIDIEDTGIGIPSDKLERIFDEYYQIDVSSNAKTGVGLGLAIVREVSRLLHLPVTLTSVIGVGTRARVTIPNTLIRTAEHVDTPIAAPPSSVSNETPRVFLVEDVASVRTATKLFLELEGYQVNAFASSAEAQGAFATLRKGDVIIADYHLDGQTTGLDMLTALRERLHWVVPAIVMSGDLPTVMRSIKAPVANARFLNKPVDIKALLGALDELKNTS